MKYFFIFLLQLFFTKLFFAQGIYLSANDFSIQKLSFQKIEHKKYRFNENVIFNSKKINIHIGDSSFSLYKDSIFGYKNKNNLTYRFYKSKSYQIINPTETILIYKTLNAPAQKHQKATYTYYFSNTTDTLLLPLTVYNLVSQFQKNKLFITYIELHFSSNANLLEFDTIHQQYKINRLLQLSTQNN